MSKVKIILGLGVWIAVLSYLGFPYSLKSILFSVSGLGIIYLSFMLYKDLEKGERQEKSFDNFSENSNFEENYIKKEGSADISTE